MKLATFQFPDLEFLYYSFFKYGDMDIRPNGLDIVQTSVAQIRSNLFLNTRKIDSVLHPFGYLHLYGKFPEDFSWNHYGLKCCLRIPYDPLHEYVILQRTHERRDSRRNSNLIVGT